MATTGTAYGPAGLHLLKGDLDFDTATVKASLHTSAYTPNKDDEFFAAVTNEVADGSYAAGGEALTGVATAYDAANDRSVLDADDTVFPALTATFRYVVLRVDTGAAATSPLLGWIDYGVDQVIGGVDCTIVWNAAGILRLV